MMPLYIPWLTEAIKKRGVRYLLHLYLGQFFEEKLTLEQLSIDIYDGKGSIKDLTLNVNGLNDELDFVPFKFLDGCSIGQVSVEVPWVSLATEACKVELDGAKFVCRLKNSSDGAKTHCTESTMLNRSLMTSSMQIAEDIVSTEDDEDYESPHSSVYKHYHGRDTQSQKRREASQMFEGLEMFAQLIDSVLRRTKLTARNTLFQIQPRTSTSQQRNEPSSCNQPRPKRVGTDNLEDDSKRFLDETDDEEFENQTHENNTIEFFIKFFRCEEILEQADVNSKEGSKAADNDGETKPQFIIPETVSKILTLEDVEMHIGGLPVSNLVGKHTIMIKFNGQKSEISIFSGSPLLAVISQSQLKAFFRVFDNVIDGDNSSSPSEEKNQKIMSPEDYSKIENQLLESASRRAVNQIHDYGFVGSNLISANSGRRWIDNGDPYADIGAQRELDCDFHSPNCSSTTTCYDGRCSDTRPLESLDAFSCQLKLPGIWLCILRDGEPLPPMMKPYADSINSFSAINKYIDEHIQVPHIRILALKVALDITTNVIDTFLGDLDISERLHETSLKSSLHLLHSDLNQKGHMKSSRYKVSISNSKEITIESFTETRLTLDPTMIDRMIFDYKLIDINKRDHNLKQTTTAKHRKNRSGLDLTLKGDQFKLELLCPIIDLTPEAKLKTTQLRPQSFLFVLRDAVLTWHSDKLELTADTLNVCVKNQPQQPDEDAVKFIEASSRDNDKITLVLEPNPSNLDSAFPNEVEDALNESSLYDSIYIAHATESRIPKEAFQTKRKVVRGSANQGNSTKSQYCSKVNECDQEKIVTPGDRQHLEDFLSQTSMFTRLSLSMKLPVCEAEFEDKEQLDLIYNRFANDFVFWQPRAFSKDNDSEVGQDSRRDSRHISIDEIMKPSKYRNTDYQCSDMSDQDSEVSFHSFRVENSNSDTYDNEATCRINVDELFVRFNHQGCSSSMKQEISTENLLIGLIIDINKKPGTIFSLVSDNLELSTDSDTVVEGNRFGDKKSTFSLTAEIKRPTKQIKDIKLALQLKDGLFTNFKVDTYTRFWQSINVTDEPIRGYVAPKIIIELHVDILDTALSLVRDGLRPALLTIDELYLNSMVMERTSQIMIRMIADEVSLYMKRNRRSPDMIKNYICLIDSGLIDLDVKFSRDGRLEFGLINNVIAVRVCQDSLSALCELFDALIKSNKTTNETNPSHHQIDTHKTDGSFPTTKDSTGTTFAFREQYHQYLGRIDEHSTREINLLQDAMNDFGDKVSYSPSHLPPQPVSRKDDNYDSDEDDTCSNDSDPPVMQRARRGDTNSCLMDESNPELGDLFSAPLIPTSEDNIDNSIDDLRLGDYPVDESGFFVIGDDDVGAGIIGKEQREPAIRKLINGPINILENHFKMTKPRSLPEKLASSLERYVLEEMTLVISLYGGKDFDDEKLEGDPKKVVDDTEKELEKTTTEPGSSSEQDNISIRSRSHSVTGSKRGSLKGTGHSDESHSSSKRKGYRRKYLSEGGGDFMKGKVSNEAARVRFGEGAVNLWESLDLMSSPDFIGAKQSTEKLINADTKFAGGTWRQTDVCIQLTLSKVKVLYEIGGTDSPISWRFILFIQDIEVKDRVQASDINKMLYEYCSESMPKRNTQLLSIKNTATINTSDGCEECDLRVSIKPLRLNIDQDTLIFLIEFFTSLNKSLSKPQPVYGSSKVSSGTESGSSLVTQMEHANQMDNVQDSINDESDRIDRKAYGGNQLQESDPGTRRGQVSDDSASLSSSSSGQKETSYYDSARGKSRSTNKTRVTGQSTGTELPTHCHADTGSGVKEQRAIYIKSFTFSPDVPIRLDYHAKHLDFDQGALAGILMGLAHLDHSELVLRRVQALHGMRGLDRALLFAINSWISDIKRNQLPSILGGVGPMHSVVQLFQGVRDLIWMPIDHYRKDRRLVRGLQRGASSFSSSTAMAAINLMNRFISMVQCTAQIAHDIVTPPRHSSGGRRARRTHRTTYNTNSRGQSDDIFHQGGHSQSSIPGLSSESPYVGVLNQPRNFCEGVAVGFTILKEGFNDTARNVAAGMQGEDMRCALGELVRQIPSSILSPIISATEGAQNVLVGIRNQIAPDARREDQEKWKSRVRGK